MSTDPIPLSERTDLEGRLLWQAQWDGYNAGPLCAEAAARIAELEGAMRCCLREAGLLGHRKDKAPFDHLWLALSEPDTAVGVQS